MIDVQSGDYGMKEQDVLKRKNSNGFGGLKTEIKICKFKKWNRAALKRFPMSLYCVVIFYWCVFHGYSQCKIFPLELIW